MSQLKDGRDVEMPCVHIISDSEESNPLENGFAGFPSAQKRLPAVVEPAKEPPSARKKLKIDGDGVEIVEENAIDIDSISTNPRRTRTKVSSDTSSKFPVSSPSDALPVGGHRKKYVKNTLPAGAFERMLNEVAQSHPLMTFQEKLDKWNCCDDLSDVEDVNNFDDTFQKREQLYKKTSGRRSAAGKDSPHPNYNYQHFRLVILESLKGSPVSSTPSPDTHKKEASADQQPSCSKELNATATNTTVTVNPDSSTVIHYEKILCPSSDSSAAKGSPSIRLHWTDEDSVFRLNRLNPEIDKFSQLIKMRIDYNKQINLKTKINEIFKTPTVPPKHNGTCDLHEPSNDSELATSEARPAEEHAKKKKKVAEKKIPTRRSTRGKSADSRRSVEKKSTTRRNSEKLPEVSSFQQDEFCNYLGLGMNGKVYSPTPTDNKRRSLRVRKQIHHVETTKKKSDKKESKKEKGPSDGNKTEEADEEYVEDKEEEVTTTVNEMRNPRFEPVTIKILERTAQEEPKQRRSCASGVIATELLSKTPEIKILLQIRNSPMTRHTPSTATTANSAAAPIRRVRRTRATSNGTSTCPRSSQSDESPNKATPRRRRLQHHTRRNNHTSDVSESLLSDPQQTEGSPPQNGRTSTVPSSDGRKEGTPTISQADVPGDENLHNKFQRYLQESRKATPSIFIVESMNNSGSKAEETTPPTTTTNCLTNNNNVPTEQSHSEKLSNKVRTWPKKHQIHRRLPRRNGTLSVALNQRILRNRTVMKPLRIKISKHPMRTKIKAMKKKEVEAHLAKKKLAEQSKAAEKTLQQEVSSDSEEKQAENSIATLAEAYEDVQEGVKETEHSSPSLIEVYEKAEPMQTEIELENFEEEPCHLAQIDPLSEVVSPKEQLATEDAEIQTEPCKTPLSIGFLTSPSIRMQNPLSSENGSVVYAYYELDILTVVQDLMVTFWKTSKLIQVLSKSTCEWMYLGECKRLLFDEEIHAPYKNRICVHNSIPIYMEMRAKELSKIRRDCNLISVYINVYYYHDEELVAKSHSIQLDTVASLPQNVVYTTITDSRYFVMCWSQETILGKPRSGLCKYSLTPHLDTLASIREFKCMRHEIRYLECTTDDNLIGFGDTQVTLWDHRSGDILMNYDLDFKLGSNFGSVYYPSLEVGQDKTVLIFQKTSAQELSIIAINISHNAPSHRFVCTHSLPAEFEHLQSSMRTDDYIILTNAERQELWIDCSDPKYMMKIKTPEGQCRFYARCKQNVIDIADDHLALETFSNFVLKLINGTEKREK